MTIPAATFAGDSGVKAFDPKAEAERMTYVELNEALVPHSTELVAILDAGGHMRYLSPSIKRLLGYDARELLGARPVDFVHPDDLPILMETFAFLQGTPGATREMCVRMRHRKGSWRWMEGAGENKLADPVIHGIICNCHDVTDRIELEQKVQASERRFRAMLEGSSDIVLLVDELARPTYVSPSVQRVLGFDRMPAPEAAILRYLHPDDRRAASEALCESLAKPGESVPVSVRCRGQDGGWRSLVATLTNLLGDDAVRGVVVNARDTTEEAALVERLKESHKMEAVGRLAGGIAHDFNNILMVMSFYSESLLKSAPSGLRPDVEAIKKSTERAIELTRQLLAFGRRQVLRPERCSINDVVNQSLLLARKMLREDITSVIELDAKAGLVLADAKQLGEVLVSLFGTAAAATPSGGVVKVATRSCEVSAAQAEEHAGLKPGGYVALDVSDSGPRIDPESLPKLFEPFFRSKNRDRGNGLALSAIYGVVKQSGGYIFVSSPANGGATFTVLLPRAAPVTEMAEQSPDVSLEHAGFRTVLVAEDEEGVGEVIRTILARKGYAAIVTRNGEEALAALAKPGHPVDVVVTDTIMPVMGGQAFVDRARKDRPELPVVFMSGYSDEAVTSGGKLADRSEFLRKPFSPEELVQAIQRAMGNFAKPTEDGAKLNSETVRASLQRDASTS